MPAQRRRAGAVETPKACLGAGIMPRMSIFEKNGTKPHKKNFLTRRIEEWCGRLLGAVNEGTLAEQEAEYAAGRTKRDYIWNTIGVGLWGMVFPLLTIVVTQLSGAEWAGMFSLAFVTALLLMFVGNYGVRNFQASDIDEEYSFNDYQANRILTCAVMLVAGVAYCSLRGYSDQMFLMSMGVYVYKMIDALADVYEGRLQQMDKLYLAGMSQAARSAAALVVFSFVLLVSHSVAAAAIAMAIAAAATFAVFTFPLTLLETPKSRRLDLGRTVGLLKQCFPLFVALFMYNLIDNMPKFVMEGVLTYDNQLYYNALYFPAHAILLTSGFIYKPLLLRMAAAWADPAKRKRFDLIIFIIMGVIVVISLLMAGIMGWFGLAVMSVLYGIDFEPYRGLCYVMLAAGGVTAAIEFLYQVITVLRRQRAVTKLYVITFGFSLFVPVLLVNFTGLPGAVIGYLIVMCILLVLLASEYISIRTDLRRKLTGKETAAAEMPRASRALPAAGRSTASIGDAAVFEVDENGRPRTFEAASFKGNPAEWLRGKAGGGRAGNPDRAGQAGRTGDSGRTGAPRREGGSPSPTRRARHSAEVTRQKTANARPTRRRR